MIVDPLNCSLIRRFNRDAQALSVSGRSLPLREVRHRLARMEMQYHARCGSRTFLKSYISQVVREHMLLAAIDRQTNVSTILSAFKSAAAVGFRNLHAKACLIMIVVRYLGDQGHAKQAKALVNALSRELRITADLCKSTLRAIGHK